MKNKEIKELLGEIGELKCTILCLKKKQEDENKLVNFLLENDKGDVVFALKHTLFNVDLVARYIYNGQIKEYAFGSEELFGRESEVVENNKASAILKVGDCFYKLNKETNETMDVTDIYEKANTKTTKKK